ncbi:hypothetical protein JCM10213_004590 [Rhodosporidiobolus nylandii]
MPPLPLDSSPTRRVASLLSALANCLTAGGVFTFPLWSPSLGRTAHLSSSQVNLLASAAILGEYALAAPFGALADKRGPGAVSLAAAALFLAGFGGVGWRIRAGEAANEGGRETWGGEWILLLFCYFLVGCGTAASYFCAMISCTKSAPARHSGLAIGVPCAVFGLSPLFLSSLASFFTTPLASPNHPSELDAASYLLFLAVFLALVNGIGAALIKNLPWEENLESRIVDALEQPAADRGRLAASSADSRVRQSSHGLDPEDRTPDERSSLLGHLPSPSSASDEDQSLRAFASTASFWLLGGAIFLSTGPGEMYMASLGQVLESLVQPVAGGFAPLHFPSFTPTITSALALRKRHIALLSVSNTLSRLFVGAASDWLSARSSRANRSSRSATAWGKNVRLWFVGAACIALAAAYGWGGTALSSPAGLWVVTLVTGASYGTVFTLAPALVRTRWSVESFGRNWGLLTWFSALGALLFTPLFGLLRDLASSPFPSEGDGACLGPRCYRPIFALSAASALIAAGMVAVLGKRWAYRL